MSGPAALIMLLRAVLHYPTAQNAAEQLCLVLPTELPKPETASCFLDQQAVLVRGQMEAPSPSLCLLASTFVERSRSDLQRLTREPLTSDWRPVSVAFSLVFRFTLAKKFRSRMWILVSMGWTGRPSSVASSLSSLWIQ